MSVLHGDTEHLHLHIAINKIHPEKLTIHEPFYDHRELARVCTELERQYGLVVDNHTFRTQARPNAAINMEKAGDIESLTGLDTAQLPCRFEGCAGLEGVRRCFGEARPDAEG